MNFESLESRKLLAGVTILTHGNAGNITGWVDSAADAIQDRLGGTSAASQYVMKVDGDGVSSFKLESGNKPLDETSKGEAIVKLDWSDIANTSHFTDSVASDVADYLLAHHEGVPDLTALPFQLIGHSRGASLMVALSYDLGQRGIWVDQVTNLDPHPIDKIKIPFVGSFGDAEMKTYENVMFSDTYYRNGGSDIIDPHGQAVDGSHNSNLNDSVQKKNLISAHLGVTAYYHGTIDLDAVANKDAPIFKSWYDGSSSDKPARSKTGFVFSRIGGGDRPVDGVGEQFGGTAGRSSVKFQGAQWSNITNVRVVGASTIGVNQPITVKGIYDDRDSAAKVTFFLDKDQNPLNANNALVLGTTNVAKSDSPHSVTMDARAKGISTGDYYLGAKISDADGHVRYAYGASAISLERADFAMFKNGVVSVAGTSKADTIVVSRSGSGNNSVVRVTRNGLTQTLDTPNVSQISIDAGGGDDVVVGDTGTPAMYVLGGDGDDLLQGGAGNDTLTGGAGRNKIFGNDGNDRLNGSGGRDQLFGGAGVDRLYGNAGNDLLDGGGGVDRLFGGDGNDMLIGGSSNDKLYGEAGNDTLFGQDQNDILEGGAGNDSLNGGPGHDTFRGNSGDDVINSRDGNIESIDGGSGSDRGRMDSVDKNVSVEILEVSS